MVRIVSIPSLHRHLYWWEVRILIESGFIHTHSSKHEYLHCPGPFMGNYSQMYIYELHDLNLSMSELNLASVINISVTLMITIYSRHRTQYAAHVTTQSSLISPFLRVSPSLFTLGIKD